MRFKWGAAGHWGGLSRVGLGGRLHSHARRGGVGCGSRGSGKEGGGKKRKLIIKKKVNKILCDDG